MNGEETEVKKILAGLKEEEEEEGSEKHHQKIGKGGYSPSPTSKDKNLGRRVITRRSAEDANANEDEDEDELAKDQAQVIADSEEAEESDVTQYSDASASSDPAIEIPDEVSRAKNNPEATESPTPTTTTAAAAETETEKETETKPETEIETETETPLRRRVGRPKGSRNKR